jgi:hypothetical protein
MGRSGPCGPAAQSGAEKEEAARTAGRQSELTSGYDFFSANHPRGPVPRPPLLPQPRGDGAPLSFGQEPLWLLQRLAPHSPAYSSPVTLRISGSLGAEAPERAVGEIVRRHETLRTVIVGADGVPAQRVFPFAGFRLPVHDLTARRSRGGCR